MGEIIMPKMGDAMTEGKVVRWYKKAGDALKAGEPVLEIETDKVNLDLEAEEDGVLEEVTAAEGATIPVGGRLASVRGKGDTSTAAEKPSEPEPQAKEPQTQPAPKAAPGPGPEGPAKAEVVPIRPDSGVPAARRSGERVRSSPLARRIAHDLGVELGELQGSGPGGRIIAADIRKAAEASPAEARSQMRPAEARGPAQELFHPPSKLTEKEIPLTAMRRTIAKRLVESIGPVPHFYLTIDCDVTVLQSLREQFNGIEGMKVSINDFVIRAAALSLRHHPNVNASFGGESIVQHGSVHIGVAVATPEGLITPVVRDADARTIPEIAEEVRSLAERARNRKLKPDDYQGSTFTISNLGMYGIEEFTAIINPPNAAILAVGAAGPRPVVIDGRIEVRQRMKVTLSCDHRVVDGAAGAEYLRTFQQYIEQPLRLVL